MKRNNYNTRWKKRQIKVVIIILILVACTVSPSIKDEFFPKEKDFGQITEQEQPINASDKNKNDVETKNEDSNHSSTQEVSPYSIVKNNSREGFCSRIRC